MELSNFEAKFEIRCHSYMWWSSLSKCFSSFGVSFISFVELMVKFPVCRLEKKENCIICLNITSGGNLETARFRCGHAHP